MSGPETLGHGIPGVSLASYRTRPAGACVRRTQSGTRRAAGLWKAIATLSALLAFNCAMAGSSATDLDGPFEIDHRWHYDNHGIWSRNAQLALQDTLVAGAIGLALYEGSDNRLGLTGWKTVDSIVVTAATVQAMKIGFSRSRPAQTDDAGKFFQGNGNRSFPSGEVANVAAAVTPVLLEYGHEQPWLYPLGGALILYDAEARMKTRGHWQSDVIAGAAVGTGIGYLMHERGESLIVSLLPGGAFVGLSKRF